MDMRSRSANFNIRAIALKMTIGLAVGLASAASPLTFHGQILALAQTSQLCVTRRTHCDASCQSACTVLRLNPRRHEYRTPCVVVVFSVTALSAIRTVSRSQTFDQAPIYPKHHWLDHQCHGFTRIYPGHSPTTTRIMSAKSLTKCNRVNPSAANIAPTASCWPQPNSATTAPPGRNMCAALRAKRR